MDSQVERLVQKVWEKFQVMPESQRYLIAVSGIPGSGKTTLAAKVAQKLNAKLSSEKLALASQIKPAVFVPADGFHLTRAQLSAMPDPHTAHARRGAAYTFDAPAFLRLVKELRKPILPESTAIHAPSFDHALKDPVENDITIDKASRIVVMEGNYLSLGSGASEWKEAAELMDELWFVEIDEQIARQRLIKRHVASGITANEEEAARRADENDLVNGREIINGRVEVHEILRSVEDETWTAGSQKIDKERDAAKETRESIR